MSMHILAVLLSRQMKQPVIDLTGLTSFYDIHLAMEPDDSVPKDAQSEPAPMPDISRAVDEQLGLQLEPEKTPIDVPVVDRAAGVPIAN